MDDAFRQTLVTVAVGGLLVGLSSLVTLVAQNWYAVRRRSADIARDDRLRNEDRTNARQDAAAWFKGEQRGRYCDDIAEYVREANRLGARMRVQVEAPPGHEASDYPGVDEWERFHVALYNGAAAAYVLDPSGPLGPALDAVRQSINDYSVALQVVVAGGGRTPDATLNPMNQQFTKRVARLRELMDSHRAQPT